MPNLTFEFAWYKDSKGYELKPGFRLKPGHSLMDTKASDIQPDRIVGKGGRLVSCTPLKIGDLFERFSRIKTPEELLAFVEKYGSLTHGGKGDVVEKLLNEARDMRSRVHKHLAKLNVSVDSFGNEVRLTVRPTCLLDAIWLQYAQAGARSRVCRQCDERFLVGAAAGRRSDAEYCSPECRVKFNSLKRSRR
jgi:hypothetical protein